MQRLTIGKVHLDIQDDVLILGAGETPDLAEPVGHVESVAVAC